MIVASNVSCKLDSIESPSAGSKVLVDFVPAFDESKMLRLTML